MGSEMCIRDRGLGRDCMGRMRYEMGERDVYNQLVYFGSLWDVDMAKALAEAGQIGGGGGGGKEGEGVPAGEMKDRVLALAEQNRKRFETVKGVVDKYLDKCGRQWVAMDTLFAKLGFVAV